MRLIDADAISLEGTISDVVEEILNAPTIDAAPVVHGEWIHSRTQSEFAVSKCSICGKEQFSISHVVAGGNYCPNCGAKMRGDTK